MANVRRVGPLKLWTRYKSHGDVLVVETEHGTRTEHKRAEGGELARLAWQAYRDHDSMAAWDYACGVAPEGSQPMRPCARCGAITAGRDERPNGEVYGRCPMCLPLTPEERLLCAVAGVRTLPALDAALRRPAN